MRENQGVVDIKLFVAAKAFISYRGEILILRESPKYDDGTNANKYDVPGGRVEPGERFDEGLKREILEETGLSIAIGKPFFANEWRPAVRGEEWQIVGVFFKCEANTDKITLSSDHDDFQWIDPDEYKKYNLIENLFPVFEAYANK